MKRRTSFYLPKDAVKHLHVLSRTRAREVIEALLRKFLVVDDPRKFALFERAERHGQGGLPIYPTMHEGIYACTMCEGLSALGLTLIKHSCLPACPSVYLRKLSDDEQPLRLRLLAGPSEKALSFVLKENDSGEVNVSTQPSFGFLVVIGQG